MKRLLSYSQVGAVFALAAITLFGLASTLLADPVKEAKELVTAYYAAAKAENWEAVYLQFDSDAEISVTTDYGYGAPASTASFTASEWNSLPEPDYTPDQRAFLAQYTELSRTVEIIEAKETEGGVEVRALQSIRYKTPQYEGTSTEADSFLVTRNFGQSVIRSFTSTHTFK